MNWTPWIKALLPRKAWPLAKRARDRWRLARDRAAARAATVRIQLPPSETRAPPWSHPDAAPVVFFAGVSREELAAAWSSLGQACRDAIVREADQVVQHRFDLLGSGPVDLGSPIDWCLDFKSGARWDLAPTGQVPIEHSLPGSDIKVPWELSRFYHAPQLGAAWLLTGDKRYARAFEAQVLDWIDANPVGRGPNWTCAMEAAIRAGNWIASLPFFLPGNGLSFRFLERLELSLFEHGRHIRTHLEGTPKLRSNHYLADLQGLLYVGALFPALEEAREWTAFAARGLEEEMEWEVHADGTDFEASTSYHRLCLELLLGPALVARVKGIPIAAAFWDRLHSMFLAGRALVDASGRVPIIGDNDSGRLHMLARRDDDDWSYLLPIGAVLFDDSSLKLPGVPFSEEALLLLGPAGLERYRALPEGRAEKQCSALPDSGWFVLRRPGECLHVTCGANGQRFRGAQPDEPQHNGGHAHNDKLSITYSAGGAQVLVDPGQSCYTGDAARRNHSRSTAAHNVLQVDGLEQQALRSDYLFNIHDGRARPRVLAWRPDASEGPWFAGEHSGYSAGAGVVCRRSVEAAAGAGFAITDALERDAEGGRAAGEIAKQRMSRPLRAQFHFHAAPGLDVQASGPNRWDFGGLAELIFPPDAALQAHVDDDATAPAYGRTKLSKTLWVELLATPPFAVRWEIRPLGPSRDVAPEGTLFAVPGAPAGIRAAALSNPLTVERAAEKCTTDDDSILERTQEQLRKLPDRSLSGRPGPPADRASRSKAFERALYCRLDFWNRKSSAGGSIGHTAHVVKGFEKAGVDLRVAAGFYLPMLDPTIHPTTIPAPPDPKSFSSDFELQYLLASESMARAVAPLADRFRPDFVYERVVIGNWLAARTAARLSVPYVVEYNGSELWTRRTWGKQAPFRHERLFHEVEERQLRSADLVVVVSDGLRDELLGRGVDPARILVNPNGVDVQEFDPARLEAARRDLRARLGFGQDDIVLGFIGTFGAWHGIQTLVHCLREFVDLDPRIRVLLIGDGNLSDDVRKTVTAERLEGRVVMTGIVPQAEAASYLSSCDVFLSPHQTPPEDQRAFFGSPTKLFEYMAMGRPAIASALGQITQVVTPALHPAEIATADASSCEAVGVLVRPGEKNDLIQAVNELRQRPDLSRKIGANARRRAVEEHTWDRHIARILARLGELCGAPRVEPPE